MGMRLFVICFLFATSTVSPALASDPISILNSDTLFKLAQGDIAKM
jgi:hypothetical protein